MIYSGGEPSLPGSPKVMAPFHVDINAGDQIQSMKVSHVSHLFHVKIYVKHSKVPTMTMFNALFCSVAMMLR